ncbi:MAG: hypothetical protein LBH12_00570 [Dysgonamonadaceae bacterium]|jgi:hypothetical protein|nr:hypothetical protein [Dysgonamonadaceae bacterium]
METVFDHNITPEEIQNLGFFEQKKYLSIITDKDNIFRDLAALYYLRGKKAKAKYYADKISDDNMRIDFWRGATHP